MISVQWFEDPVTTVGVLGTVTQLFCCIIGIASVGDTSKDFAKCL